MPDWTISNVIQTEAQDDDLYRDYRDSWNEKWQIVKETICGPDHYNCEVLDAITVEMVDANAITNKAAQ